MLVSPEYRDQLEMELWYKRIGDDYALWLIEENKYFDGLEESLNEAFREKCAELDKMHKELTAASKGLRDLDNIKQLKRLHFAIEAMKEYWWDD